MLAETILFLVYFPSVPKIPNDVPCPTRVLLSAPLITLNIIPSTAELHSNIPGLEFELHFTPV